MVQLSVNSDVTKVNVLDQTNATVCHISVENIATKVCLTAFETLKLNESLLESLLDSPRDSPRDSPTR